MVVKGTFTPKLSNKLGTRKYPPAEPGALRWLAPQRGLIAIGEQLRMSRANDPSPALVPQAPSPHGRGKKATRALPRPIITVLSQGRGWRPCAAG